MSKRFHRQQTGFTLVELLIVVIILAILAAIVVPQFSSTTEDAKQSTMQSNLAAMRSAMELYYIQHGEYPGKLAATAGGSCSVPAVFSTGADTGGAFAGQMLYYTNGNGETCSTKAAGFDYGPYIKGGELPSNESSGTATNAVAISTAGDINLTAEGGDPGGWRVDTVSGQIIVNTAADQGL